MNRAFAPLVLAVSLVVSPAAIGYHLSAGAQDQAGVTGEDEPTVYDERLYELGIRRDCPEEPAVGTDDPAEDVQRVAADALDPLREFCGRLRYQADEPRVTTFSPPDQHIPHSVGGEIDENPVEAFDAVFTSYAGSYGTETCQPWCGSPSPRDLGDLCAVADVDCPVDPTDPDALNGHGDKAVGVDAFGPHTTLSLQRQTGAWYGNGWLAPAPDIGIVAFLEDRRSSPISQSMLSEIVERANLPEGATDRVCGFTPDATLEATSPTDFCEVEFEWVAEETEDPRARECQAPTYVCGAVGGGAWYADVQCSALRTSCVQLGADTPAASAGQDSPFDSTHDFDVWHFVVAPAPMDASESGAAQGGRLEPGFQVRAGWGQAPYLGHDLDVFVPANANLATG